MHASCSSENLDDLLPYELNYIPEDLRKRAETELFEDEETRVSSLRLLRSMLKDVPNLHYQDEDLFLLAFLRARKFDVKRALHLVRNFYNAKLKYKEIYDNYNYEDVKRSVAQNDIGFLPYRDSEGCVILLISFRTWNPHTNPMRDLVRAINTAILHANLSPATQIAGFKIIIDTKNFTLYHVSHMPPTYLWLCAEGLQNCFPGRFRAVHVVNEVVVFSYVWVILKQLLTQKLRNRFHFHGKNVKKLHKYFSPRILPAEYEGELPPFDNSEWAKSMEEKADYFVHIASHGYQN